MHHNQIYAWTYWIIKAVQCAVSPLKCKVLYWQTCCSAECITWWCSLQTKPPVQLQYSKTAVNVGTDPLLLSHYIYARLSTYSTYLSTLSMFITLHNIHNILCACFTNICKFTVCQHHLSIMVHILYLKFRHVSDMELDLNLVLSAASQRRITKCWYFSGTNA